MHKINIIFLEEYKHLDSFCKGLFPGDEAGVTKYINEMDITPLDKQALVDSWQEDYRALKHFRWVRNKLAHDEGSLDEELCTKADINWLKAFHTRIKKGKDPFSIIEEKLKPKKEKKPKSEKKPKREKIKKEKLKATPEQKSASNGDSLGSKVAGFFKNVLKL